MAASKREDIFLSFPLLNFKPKGLSKSLPIKIKPPLGPLRVLCVVVVTMWQWGTGSFKTPFAINPEGWEISAKRNELTLSAICLNLLKSISLEYAEAPAIIIWGFSSIAIFSILS